MQKILSCFKIETVLLKYSKNQRILADIEKAHKYMLKNEIQKHK